MPLSIRGRLLAEAHMSLCRFQAIVTGIEIGTPKPPIGWASFLGISGTIRHIPSSSNTAAIPLGLPVTSAYTLLQRMPYSCPVRFHRESVLEIPRIPPTIGRDLHNNSPRRRRRNRAEIGVGTILMGNVVTMLDIRQMFSKFPRILPSLVNQSVHVSASVRSDGSTSEQVDHSAAFIYASANDVVDKALNYVISKNQDFQDSMKTPQGKQGCFYIACP